MKTIALGLSVLCAGVTLLGAKPAHAGQAFASCSVVDVATFSNRVHIHCTKPVSGCDFQSGGCAQQQAAPPTYVAVESTSPMAPTVVQVGLFALTSKHLVDVLFDDNAGANPPGCNANDCRRLVGVVAH